MLKGKEVRIIKGYHKGRTGVVLKEGTIERFGGEVKTEGILVDAGTAGPLVLEHDQYTVLGDYKEPELKGYHTI